MRLAGTGLAGLTASVVLLLAAACGDGGGSGSDPSGTPGGAQAYAECMSKNGVTLTMPTNRPTNRPTDRPSDRPTVRPSGEPGAGMRGGGFGRPEDVDEETWQQAQRACESVRPSFGPDRGGAVTAYRNCLSDHGVTADPGSGGLSTADAKTAAALKACEALRPTARPTPSV